MFWWKLNQYLRFPSDFICSQTHEPKHRISGTSWCYLTELLHSDRLGGHRSGVQAEVPAQSGGRHPADLLRRVPQATARTHLALLTAVRVTRLPPLSLFRKLRCNSLSHWVHCVDERQAWIVSLSGFHQTNSAFYSPASFTFSKHSSEFIYSPKPI